MKAPIILTVIDKGDMSVGIYPCSWDIQTPIEKNATESLEHFRQDMIDVFKHFCDGKCVAVYDFEIDDIY